MRVTRIESRAVCLTTNEHVIKGFEQLGLKTVKDVMQTPFIRFMRNKEMLLGWSDFVKAMLPLAHMVQIED